jgi:hypothetical protein
MKKPFAFLIGLVIALCVIIYAARGRSAANIVPAHPTNPDLGTKGGATQVDTETH